MRLGAIEGGGTKFVCGIGTERGEVLERIQFPTTTPDETIGKAIDFFRQNSVEAIGIGSFGPIDLDPASPSYGFVTTTPKPGWSNTDFLGRMREAFDIPIGWDNDVNAAAMGEAAWGAAKGMDSCVYFTFGTGVGAGIYADGRPVHGMVHPEVGHIPVRRHPDDRYEGGCPYHGDCLEGLAAGPAIEKRWGVRGAELGPEHPAWDMQAWYVAQAVVAAMLWVSPKKVILGGGVMKQQQLFPLVRSKAAALLNGYIRHESIAGGFDNYIVPPALGDNAGLCGGLALALGKIR